MVDVFLNKDTLTIIAGYTHNIRNLSQVCRTIRDIILNLTTNEISRNFHQDVKKIAETGTPNMHEFVMRRSRYKGYELAIEYKNLPMLREMCRYHPFGQEHLMRLVKQAVETEFAAGAKFLCCQLINFQPCPAIFVMACDGTKDGWCDMKFLKYLVEEIGYKPQIDKYALMNAEFYMLHEVVAYLIKIGCSIPPVRYQIRRSSCSQSNSEELTFSDDY